MADEDGLSTPLDDHLFRLSEDQAETEIQGSMLVTYVFALGDGTEANLNLGLSQNVGGGGHVDKEVWKTASQPSAREAPFQSILRILHLN